MDVYRIRNLSDLHELYRGYRSHDGLGWLFRGQADLNWPLIPKAGRPEFNNGRDLGRFNAWRQRAAAYGSLPENDWECLAVAQHYGLATRLLDWSLNPLVATYFAVAELPERDAAVFCYSPNLFLDCKVQTMDPPPKGVGCFLPRALDRRVNSQGGVFTVHDNPATPLVPSLRKPPLKGFDLARIEIPASLKHDVRQMLSDYGIHAHGVFPDLDGLSRHINWQTTEMIERKRARELTKSADASTET